MVKDITFLERYIGHDCQRLELSWVGHLASVSSSWGTNLPHLLHSEISISISQSPPGKDPSVSWSACTLGDYIFSLFSAYY